MALRFYFVPEEKPDGVHRGPKYFKWRFGVGALQATDWIDYGSEAVFLVGADLTQLDHDSLILNGDVAAMPEDINLSIPANELNELRSSFENFKIPAIWINAGVSYACN